MFSFRRLKPLLLGPYKTIDVTNELFLKMSLRSIYKKLLKYLIIQKNLFCTLIVAISGVFQTQFNMIFQNQLEKQIVIHLPPVLDESLSDEQSSQEDLSSYYQSKPLLPSTKAITPLLILLQMTIHRFHKMTAHLSNEQLKLMKLIYFQTDHDTHLKTNIHFLLLQAEVLKLIITRDNNQEKFTAFS